MPHGVHFDGAALSLWWCLPFAGLLLSIALLPLLAPRFWHHHYGKTALFWGALFWAALSVQGGFATGAFTLAHVALAEFVPFIALLAALYTVAGGIRLTGTLKETPKANVMLLALGTLLASLVGTTGASMVLIRPLLRANAGRKKKAHVIIFFIFLVSNIGGSLTPLGDPPLFLGFLKGVSFFWTLHHLWPMTGFASLFLLTVFYALDGFYWRRESLPPTESQGREPLGIQGKPNLLLLLGILGSVILSGLWRAESGNPAHAALSLEGETLMTQGTALQVFLLILITWLSVRWTPRAAREGNGFTWAPMIEVAKLFAAIFVTMAGPIAILRAGQEGALGTIISHLTHDGRPVQAAYFWSTGILSSFLDNAPTYLVFFNAAGGAASHLMTGGAATLTAISAGAVFMGANSYIGNAPNLMVKAVAEEGGVKMPSFFGYMAWSGAVLIPLFLLMTWVFF